MKWLKRLTIFVVGLALVLALVAAGAYVYGVRRTPEWLRRPMASAADRAAAANRLDQKILQALSAVSEINDAQDATSRPASSDDKRPSVTQPYKQLQVSFTEDELNASFQKWDQLYGWTERYKDHVQDPSIVIHEGRIVIAGHSTDVGTVVSLHFDPKLNDDGRLDLELERVLAGRLPLPQAFFDKYRTSIGRRLQSALPDLQRKAAFKPDGSANTEAMSAAMGKLFLHVLKNEPGEPVLFLPVGQSRSVPVRLTDVTIEDKSISLTVKPLDPQERVALLERIRERFDNETAMREEPTPPPARQRGS